MVQALSLSSKALLLILNHRFQLLNALFDAINLSFNEIFAVFCITKTIAASHIGGIVFDVYLELLIIEQQSLLLLKFFLNLFLGHAKDSSDSRKSRYLENLDI